MADAVVPRPSVVARVVDQVLVAGLETIPEQKPLSNTRWRGDHDWSSRGCQSLTHLSLCVVARGLFGTYSPVVIASL